MKKLILSLILISALLSSYCQTLTLKEMIEQTKCTTFSCFNDFLLQKGFSYSGVDTECCNGELYYYHSDVFYDTIGDKMYKTISQFMIADGKSTPYSFITFSTNGKRNYLSFVKQLSANGFKSSKEEKKGNESGEIVITYVSNKFPKIEVMISIKMLEKDGRKYTNYHISVIRK